MTRPRKSVTEVLSLTDSVELSFGAEDLGYSDTDEACKLLIDLASHPDAIVREGVCYGLSRHLHRDIARKTLEQLGTSDNNATIRMCAAEALEYS
jgi:hypothetical protein